MPVSTYYQPSVLADVRILLVDPDKINRTIVTSLIENMKPARFMVEKSAADARSVLAGRVDAFEYHLTGS